jgi:hypothetical protein
VSARAIDQLMAGNKYGVANLFSFLMDGMLVDLMQRCGECLRHKKKK